MGKIEKGTFADGDSSLEQPADQSSAPSAPSVPTPPAAPTPPKPPKNEEPLELPKGALIAYRKSGGLKFSSREIVVYPDGRVTYGGGDTSKNILQRASRKLMDAQVVKLRRTLDQSGFWKVKPPAGKHGGDAFAMEIVARVGANSNQMEVFTGAIPDSLKLLIEQLDKLLPREE